MSAIYLDPSGYQVFVTNSIKSDGKKMWAEYYGINTGSGRQVTKKTKNAAMAERLLKTYAKGENPPLKKSKGWAACFGEKCRSCDSGSICDGRIAMKLRGKAGR